MARQLSLNLRLLFASGLILPLFLGLTAAMLDRAFHANQLLAQEARMSLFQLLLARSADWTGDHWEIGELDDLRFSLTGSGLYAFIFNAEGAIQWQSTSAESLDLPSAQLLTSLGITSLPGLGEEQFQPCDLDGPNFCHLKGVAWGSEGPQSVFLVAESQEALRAARRDYRDSLLWLLLATAALLVAAQLSVVHLGLLPLRQLARQIRQLETGAADRLPDAVPAELRPLTESVNQLLNSERQRRERVRNTMDRLAHVLKSPLMLIRNSDDDPAGFRGLVDDQVGRMLGVIEGELARARLDGRSSDLLGRAIVVRPVLERIATAYARLPRPQGAPPVAIAMESVAADAAFFGDQRDLQDLFGSILENSLKYSQTQIDIRAEMRQEDGQRLLYLAVGDDGDGVPAGAEGYILQRGGRADSAGAGYGLGLSIVIAIVSAYGGSLHVGRAALGGALFEVLLPMPVSP